MKQARLIYNPSAGREIVRNNLADILETLENSGYETSTFATKGKGDASSEALKASKKGYDLIVAAGGDGTIYEVVNGISPLEKRPSLAILPMGTSNDFAKSIGIPRRLPEALEVIEKGDFKPVDIGRMNDRYFINIGGGGSLTELTYDCPPRMKTIWGQFAYYIKGIEKLPSLKPVTIEYEYNGMLKTEEVMLFMVSNGNTVGGFEKFAPKAQIDDGLFDVFLLKKCNFPELIRVMSMLPSGKHIYDDKVLNFKTSYLRVVPSEDVQINLDGELGGITPCEFTNLKHHLNVLMN